MRFKKEVWIAGICTAVIIIIFAGMVPVWIYRHRERAVVRKSVSVNWEEQYPFAQQDRGETRTGYPLLQWYQDKIYGIEELIGITVNNNTLFRYSLSEIYCGLEKGMGISKIESADKAVMVLEDGYFSYCNDRRDNAVVADRVKDFQISLNGEGIGFLYVMAPYKCAKTDEDNRYRGYVDYTRSNAETLAAELRERGVNMLNLQERAAGCGYNVHELLFKTDHHWKPGTALWGAGEVARELNGSYGFDIDLTLYAQDNFVVNRYKDKFLGSQGKKVTLAYADVEDFEVITPGYQTEYHVGVPQYGLLLDGTFEETLIDQAALSDKGYTAKYYETNAYAAYGYGDQPLITVKNLNIDDRRRVLVIKDSFADTLAPFLSLGLSDMAIIDLRHFTGSLQTYIADYNPDLVMMVMSGGTQPGIDNDFEEHKNMYDFR